MFRFAPAGLTTERAFRLRAYHRSEFAGCDTLSCVRTLVVVLVVVVIGCGGTNSETCVPGDSKSCTGPGPCAGYQVCQANRTYNACMCNVGDGGSVAGGANGGPAGSSGSAGVGGGTAGTLGVTGNGGMTGAGRAVAGYRV